MTASTEHGEKKASPHHRYGYGEVPPIPPETTVGWAETIWRHGAPPGAKLKWLAERVPVLRRADSLESLISPYVTSWGKRGDITAVLRSEARLHRLDALDDRALARITRTYEAYGWACETHRSFGVWHDTLIDGWDAYWARRPGTLRETVRRRGKDARAILVPAADAAAVVARVAAKAWQDDEPFPTFVPEAILRGARDGWVRVYALDSGFDVPAAQLWLVGGGHASLAKTWHDKDAAPRSPGTVLTEAALRALYAGGAQTIDFGRGDDPYKASWATMRAERWGVVARPLGTPGGILLATRSKVKRALRHN